MNRPVVTGSATLNPPELDLRYTEVEEELRAGVRAMLARVCPPEQVLAGIEQSPPAAPPLWRTLAVEMELAGLTIPAQYGGAGASLREAAVVLEELGRGIAPVPYLGSAVLATSLLVLLDDRALLTELAGGATVAALAVPFGAGPAEPTPTVRAALTGPGTATLVGSVTGVADALTADTLLVPTEAGVYAVEADAVGVSRRPLVSLDLTRPLCALTLTDVPGRELASGVAAATAVSTTWQIGAALLAAEQLGVAQWCLDTTVAYVQTRLQFGRPVGSFQALKHRLADVWVAIAQARAVSRYAAGCAAGALATATGAGAGDGSAGQDLPVAAALAQAYCGPMAVHAAQECVQLHGGIGFTWEHPAHLYLKRAKSDALAWGTADRHRLALAGLLDLPPALCADQGKV